MRNVADNVGKKVKTSKLCSLTLPGSRAIYEIIWKYCGRGRQATEGNAIRRKLLHADDYGYTHKHTHTHTEYVVLTSLLQEKWLHERNTVLRYTYIACLVFVSCYSVRLYPKSQSPTHYRRLFLVSSAGGGLHIPFG